jgi:GNAT superfamily N-acetyltransferase
VTIREARSEEVASTAELRHAMILELDDTDIDVAHPAWRERHVAFYAPRIDDDRAAILLAEADGERIAMAAVYAVENHRSEIFGQHSAYVSNVYVVPAHRRRGVATALMRRANQWARERGCGVIRLRSSAGGRRLYEALGFGPTSEMELRLDASYAS